MLLYLVMFCISLFVATKIDRIYKCMLIKLFCTALEYKIKRLTIQWILYVSSSVVQVVRSYLPSMKSRHIMLIQDYHGI